MPSFGLESPWVLALILPGVVAAVIVMRRSISPLRPVRRVVGVAGMCLAFLTLLLGAAGFSIRVPAERRTVWVLLDRSLSVGDGAALRLEGILRELKASLHPDDLVGVIVYADRAELALPPAPAAHLDPGFALPPAEFADETFLDSAVALASRLTPRATIPFALLVGDGHDSADRYGGSVIDEVRRFGRHGSARAPRVFPIPVDSDPAPEIAIAGLSARIGGPDNRAVSIDLGIFSTVAQSVVIEVRVNGESAGERLWAETLDRQGVAPVAAGRNTLRLTYEAPEPRPSYRIELTLSAPHDTYGGNNSARLFLQAGQEGSVLLIHGSDGRERTLEQGLRRHGLAVSTGRASLLPVDFEGLRRFSIVILANVSIDDLPAPRQEALRRYTRAGGGLAVIGGPQAFAPGGYFGSTLEALLPVDSRLDARPRAAAVVVAFDRSGSMGAMVGSAGSPHEAVSKMDLANEGAVRVLRLAPPGAWFGMLSVDTGPEWIIPLEPLTDRAAAAARARSNSPMGGGIYVDVAAREAFAALAAVRAETRHLVLFSDGADTERQEGVLEMTARAREDFGITVTTICLGDGKDRRFLEQMAEAGGGRFYFVDDPSELPAVFSREAAETGGAFLRENAFRPVMGRPGVLTRGFDFEAPETPPLLGYVATSPRDGADVWLWADEDRERPLLATWQIELGRVLAFTSDARDRWAEPWLDWPGYDELWGRWIRWLSPAPGENAFETEWTHGRGGPIMDIRFFDDRGEPRDLADPAAEITIPDGLSMPARLMPRGAGAYRVRFPRLGSGVYEVRVRERDESGGYRLVAREYHVFAPTLELARQPADHATLSRIAEVTGGRIAVSPRDVATAPAEGVAHLKPMRESFVWMAVIGLFLALGARRLPGVWRRGDESAPVPALDEPINAAFARVRGRRREGAGSARLAKVGAGSPPRPAAPPPPPRDEPRRPDSTVPPSGGTDESLLSAMRNARKQLKKWEQK